MRSLVAAAAIATCFVGSTAFAADEVTTLEAQLGKETSELSTSDCLAACKALASIRRAADRICELEPGPRCDAARAKADRAAERVREACPQCAIAERPKPEPEKRATAPSEAPPPQAAPTAETSEARGGCRNCATTGGAPDRGDFAVFALAALLVGRRARKDRRRL